MTDLNFVSVDFNVSILKKHTQMMGVLKFFIANNKNMA